MYSATVQVYVRNWFFAQQIIAIAERMSTLDLSSLLVFYAIRRNKELKTQKTYIEYVMLYTYVRIVSIEINEATYFVPSETAVIKYSILTLFV